jgi:DNA-binding Lrp family transcriptional regulator
VLDAQGKSLNRLDIRILEILQKDCRTPLQKVANELGVPKSTVHYRIRKLEEEGIIQGYGAKVDATRLGKDYTTITFVRAKYGPRYHEKVGEILARIPGILAVYFVFGEIDFVALIRSDNRDDFMRKLERMTSTPEIERTSTLVTAKTIIENPLVDLES